MENLYSIYREYNPTSSVEFALTASFISKDEINLIIGKTSVLEVYSVISIDNDEVFF